jgi:TonB family protein
MTTLIQSLIHTSGQPMVQALGWTLLHFLWQGAVVAAALWCALRLLNGRSSPARYTAACLALGLMILAPMATFAHIASAEYSMRSVASFSVVAVDPGMLMPVGIAEPAASWPVRAAAALDHCIPWMLLIWSAGVILFVARLNLGLIVARRLKSAGATPPSHDLQQVFERVRARLGVARAVKLTHSAMVDVPTVIGWLRPVVLLPVSCLTGLSALQIEAILCHELAHVRRHDYLVSVFQSLVEAMLFYHPAVWWVSKQVRRERECCCDEIAVAMGGDVLAYARALSYLEERRASYPEFVLGANGGVLKMRIKRLLGRKEDQVASQFAALAVLAVALAAGASYAVTVARAQTRPAQLPVLMHDQPLEPVQSTQEIALVEPVGTFKTTHPFQESAVTADSSPRPLTGVYKTWLEQDVLWIITPQERAQYLRLTSDEERNRFIVDFWARRDPPGAPKDTYRQEHYVRIAYTNQHYAADQPGWRSDRGRFYIAYGKPDDIDSHPSGGEYQSPAGRITSTYPFEVWHYRYIPGVGKDVDLEFVDTCQCGRYNYTIDHLSAPGSAELQTGHAGAVLLAAKLFSPAQSASPQPSALLMPAVVPGQPIQLPSGFMERQSQTRVWPVYPDIARNAHVQGTVVLRETISKTGSVDSVMVISGAPMLNASAMDAVRQWTYQPYQLNGEPQQVSTAVSLTYRIFDDGAATIKFSEPDPIRVSGGTAAGMLLTKVDPAYPPDAKAAGIQGAVVLKAIISTLGTVEGLTVVSGPPQLTGSAMDAVKQWVYQPYLLNGQPTPVSTTITVNFTLADASASTPNPAVAASALPTQTSSAPQDHIGSPVKKIGDGVTPPIPIYEVAPEYTQEARKARAAGTVLVGLIVDENGLPQNVHVVRGFGIGQDGKPDPKLKKAARASADGMNQEALNAVMQYKFRPAMEAGKPAPVQVNLEVNFKIF